MFIGLYPRLKLRPRRMLILDNGSLFHAEYMQWKEVRYCTTSSRERVTASVLGVLSTESSSTLINISATFHESHSDFSSTLSLLKYSGLYLYLVLLFFIGITVHCFVHLFQTMHRLSKCSRCLFSHHHLLMRLWSAEPKFQLIGLRSSSA